MTDSGYYQRLTPVYGLDGSLRLHSRVLGGLELRLERGNLRLYDPQTGKYLFTYSEAVAAYQEAEEQRQLAQQQVELALQREEFLANQLRALGVNPDEILKNWKPH